MKATLLVDLSLLVFLATLVAIGRPVLGQWQSVPLKRTVDSVAPWTGIVLWTDNDRNDADAIQLEYSYMRYNEVAIARGSYDWTHVEKLLDDVASRGHQAVLRFYFVYPGKPTMVPTFVRSLDDYKEITGKSEGKKTGFVDWSHSAIEQFTLDFYSTFARRYDTDTRLAYLQVGFGLWSEYHIYDGPLTGSQTLGRTFPSKAFQSKFVTHLGSVFEQTPWMISIDAADGDYSPFEEQPKLLKTSFGLFDDSFLCKPHSKENAQNWRFFGERWKRSPAGGEFSYYSKRDQRLALSAMGPNGRSFDDMSAEFHITFMIGNDQPGYQSMKRISEAAMMTGYRLRISTFETSETASRVTVSNVGIAPPYHDAYVAVDGVRAANSLRGLLPGESRTFEVAIGGETPKLTIQSDRLVEGQSIPFEANVK